MAVNLKGPFLCSQAVIDTMKKQKSGRIISLGSLAGQVGGPWLHLRPIQHPKRVLCVLRSP